MMTCAISGSGCAISASPSSSRLVFNKFELNKRRNLQYGLRVRASSDDAEDCNSEECAPDKEVGKVSMEWLATEKTKIAGTFPPRTRGWTGYVEKDTAGQTNIYSVEPVVYIAESAISSGTAGSSADGSENTLAISGFVALISVAAASSILLRMANTPPVVKTADYSGPSLSYYISKFSPPQAIEASDPPVTEESAPPVTEAPSAPLQTETSAQEVSQIEAQVEPQQETSPSGSIVS
ncbi:hypothetical protein ACS0TY_003356 [Phlomoides rotata]